jgi:DtxR family Mn-dependent transcriptional regulator
MVKALAESGLVEYEPYSGVALTPAGHKLAALVLRRHRLVELFLVRVHGLRVGRGARRGRSSSNTSCPDRLIDRMDEMLGRPKSIRTATDPNADGQVKPQESQSLMTCPIGAPVTVTRVVDQDSAFLRFVDRHHLKPGAAIQVEERDASADSVRRARRGRPLITIGTRAASKLLVQVARTALLLLLAACAGAGAGHATPKRAARAPTSRATWISTTTSPSSPTARSTSTASCCSSRTRSATASAS